MLKKTWKLFGGSIYNTTSIQETPTWDFQIVYAATKRLPRFINIYRFHHTRGAETSLARPGRKQALKHVRGARDFNNIETRAVIKFFFFCKARRRRKFTLFWQKH